MGLTKPRAAQIYNLDYKQATRAVTVANITLAGGAPSVVDGVSLSLNDRVLVTAQSTGSQNGLYLVTTVGSGSNGTWARTTDANATGEIDAGMIVMVTEGTTYADTQWKLITDNPITIDTTALTFTQNYSANSITGGTSNVTVYSNANVTISSAGTPNVLTVSSTGTVTSGTVSVTGNITGGNVSGTNLTGTTVSVTGNVNGGNISTVGLITATGNVYTGNILAGGYYYANGAVFGGGGGGGTPGGSNTYVQFNDNGVFNGSAGFTFNKTTNSLSTTGAVSTTGTITGASVVGGVMTGSSVSVSGTVTGASVVGGVMTGSSVSVSGTITGGAHNGTSVSVSGTVTGASVVGGVMTGSSVSVTGAVSGASVVGGVITGTSTSVSGGVTAASVAGGVITGSSVSASGTVTGSSFTGAGTGLTGTASSLTVGAASSATTAGTVTTAAQPNITSVGTLTGLTVSGTATFNSTTNGPFPSTYSFPNTGASATWVKLGTFTVPQGGYHLTIKVVGASGYNATIGQDYEGFIHFKTSNGGSVDANGFAADCYYWTTGPSAGSLSNVVVVGNAAGTSATAYTFYIYGGAYSGTAPFYTVEQATSIGAWTNQATLASPSGTTGSSTVCVATNTYYAGSSIVPSANVTYNLGSSTAWWSTIYGTAIHAQYADLAEIYVADNVYTPGTVVEFGGNNEITITNTTHSTQVAGIISTQPAYLMNSTQAGEHPLEVALVGRVPCSVVGTIRKGDRLVSSNIPGVAQALNINLYQPGCIIGKALEEYNSAESGVIEVAVGRL